MRDLYQIEYVVSSGKEDSGNTVLVGSVRICTVFISEGRRPGLFVRVLKHLGHGMGEEAAAAGIDGRKLARPPSMDAGRKAGGTWWQKGEKADSIRRAKSCVGAIPGRIV